MKPLETLSTRTLSVPDRWCIHSYYVMCPYAPDGSGRLVVAGYDLEADEGEVLVLGAGGDIQARFGRGPVRTAFYHTGRWQGWSPDARYIYYQRGPTDQPEIVRHDLTTGQEIAQYGDIEMIPPDGEPLLCGLMGLLYAAGHGDHVYRPDKAPYPFQARSEHGLFRYSFDPLQQELALSVADVLEQHPQRDAIRQADNDIKQRLGVDDGLTLMLYAVRYSPDGQRVLFYFGNHTVNTHAPERGEPRIGTVFTANRDLTDLRMAVDLSFGKRGVHWSWHPDGQHLVGYGEDPDQPGRQALIQVNSRDKDDVRRLSGHNSGGHPSVCPANYDLVVTDASRVLDSQTVGQVLFIDIGRDEILSCLELPRVNREDRPPGRSRHVVDHHPVFAPDGSKVLVNTLPGEHAVLTEITVPEQWR